MISVTVDFVAKDGQGLTIYGHKSENVCVYPCMGLEIDMGNKYVGTASLQHCQHIYTSYIKIQFRPASNMPA